MKGLHPSSFYSNNSEVSESRSMVSARIRRNGSKVFKAFVFLHLTISKELKGELEQRI